MKYLTQGQIFLRKGLPCNPKGKKGGLDLSGQRIVHREGKGKGSLSTKYKDTEEPSPFHLEGTSDPYSYSLGMPAF